MERSEMSILLKADVRFNLLILKGWVLRFKSAYHHNLLCKTLLHSKNKSNQKQRIKAISSSI